jgi:hypothetical protein
LSTLAKTLVFAHPSLSATIQAPFPEIRLTLPLSGRQGDWGGVVES